MQVKFCGITQIDDAKAAVALGADAIGLVFYPPSPRAVSLETAKALSAVIPPFTSIVALVVNASGDDVRQICQTVPVDVIQFHGDESAVECQALAGVVNKRWIKALRVNSKTDTQASVAQKISDFAAAGASGVILDAYHEAQYGGTGQRFDWELIPDNSALPIILAGGLTPENVAQTLSLAVAGVDVSGGIEAQKGKKDAAKMRAFMKAVKRDRWQL